MAESNLVEEAFSRLNAQPGFVGALVVNDCGIAIKSTFENSESVRYAALVSQFCFKARGVLRRMDAENELKHIRVRSKKRELIIASEFAAPGSEYYVVVVQDPNPM